MMAPPELRSELQREEAQRGQRGMPQAARARVWSRVQASIHEERAPVRRRAPVWRIAAGAAVVLVIGAGLLLWRPTPPVRDQQFVGGLELLASSTNLVIREHGAEVELQGGHATLADAERGLTMESSGLLQFRREAAGVRVVRGEASFSVRPRRQGEAPVVVLVSAGEIQVVGTRFTVDEAGTRGAVVLHEGVIRFRSDSGEEVLLRPGETLSWPLPAKAAPQSPSPAPAPSRPTEQRKPPPSPAAPAPNVEEVLREVEVLRSRGDFEQAARQLEGAIRQQPPATRELLSFELGSVLTHQLRDSKRACAHWAQHSRSFQGGRFEEHVERARAALGCDEDPR